MSTSPWLQLSEIVDRRANLAQMGQAAAVSGDLEMARYLFRLAKQAEADRQRVVDLLCETASELGLKFDAQEDEWGYRTRPSRPIPSEGRSAVGHERPARTATTFRVE